MKVRILNYQYLVDFNLLPEIEKNRLRWKGPIKSRLYKIINAGKRDILMIINEKYLERKLYA
jgi:hypothetical protein